MFIFSSRNKITNETTITTIPNTTLENFACFACNKNMSEHQNEENLSVFKTARDYHSFKLRMEDDTSEMIFATRGKNSIIAIIADECLPLISGYRFGFTLKLSKDSEEKSYMPKKCINESDEYSQEYLMSKGFYTLNDMHTRGFIKIDTKI